MPGGLGITPGLDSVMVLCLAWVLAPIDLFLTGKRLVENLINRKR